MIAPVDPELAKAALEKEIREVVTADLDFAFRLGGYYNVYQRKLRKAERKGNYTAKQAVVSARADVLARQQDRVESLIEWVTRAIEGGTK
jgi:hypothetical protein